MKKRLMIGMAALFALGCGDSGPVAGEVRVDLLAPDAVGAVQFRITSAAPNTLTSISAACAGCSLFQAQISDTEIRGVVTGNLTPGGLLNVGVSDKTNLGVYTGSVIAVAALDYQLRTPGAYGLIFPIPE